MENTDKYIFLAKAEAVHKTFPRDCRRHDTNGMPVCFRYRTGNIGVHALHNNHRTPAIQDIG